jgi:hypothetical protein
MLVEVIDTVTPGPMLGQCDVCGSTPGPWFLVARRLGAHRQLPSWPRTRPEERSPRAGDGDCRAHPVTQGDGSYEQSADRSPWQAPRTEQWPEAARSDLPLRFSVSSRPIQVALLKRWALAVPRQWLGVNRNHDGHGHEQPRRTGTAHVSGLHGAASTADAGLKAG